MSLKSQTKQPATKVIAMDENTPNAEFVQRTENFTITSLPKPYLKSDGSQPLTLANICSALENQLIKQTSIKQGKRKQKLNHDIKLLKQTRAGQAKEQGFTKDFIRKKNIFDQIEAGEHRLSVLAKRFGVSYGKVREISNMKETPVPSSSLTDQRLEEDTLLISNLIKEQSLTLLTSSKIKRILAPTKNMSRHRICFILRRLGYLFKSEMTKDARKREIASVLSEKEKTSLPEPLLSICRGLQNKHFLVFMDEYKLVLNHIPLKSWKTRGSNERVARQSSSTDHVWTIPVAVSCFEIIAYQVFKSELSGEDFRYFLLSVLQQLFHVHGNLSICVYLDQASWHKSRKVTEGMLGKYLQFNLARRPELNLIELLFSKLRNRTRSMSDYKDDQSHLEEFHGILRELNAERDFEGYLREVIRQSISHAKTALKGK